MKETGKTILIAEDSPTQAAFLKYTLEDIGYKVFHANNGIVALEILEKENPDLIISDIMMPGMNGFKLSNIVREELKSSIPIILLTSLTNKVDIIKGLESGANEFISKPIDENQLISRVNSIFNPNESNSDLNFSEELKELIVKNPERVFNFIFSTYETAINKNEELIDTQAELSELNRTLELKVEERTLELSKEIEAKNKYEKELHKAFLKVQVADRSKSHFLSTMSHELRTPLTAIIGFAGLLNKKTAPDDVEERAKLIHTSGLHLLSLIENLFEISMIESGQIKLKSEDFPLNATLQSVHELMLTEKTRLGKKDLELIPKSNFNKNELIINTDKTKLEQIFINLIKNAIKFTRKGYVKYGYHAERHQDVILLKFYVSDTGIGIPANKQEIIFDLFGQADTSDSRNMEGAGIGLAICKKLTEFLGGKIWFESEMNVGTTFYFTLPCNVVAEKDPVKIQPVNKPYPSFEDKTILLVEDDELYFEYMFKILSGMKIMVLWAKDGNDAIENCDAYPAINLVLMDIRLPLMDGFAAMESIKKKYPQIPIIAQTAYSTENEKVKALESGFDDYLSKPCDPDALIAILNQFFK